ncbi:MAG TPA: hypothetical protein VMU62_10845, partial [Acidobacteriaceae bacterium]|nr:hypothetical protein [Acidobacteriaceae bacterium]
SARQPSGPAGNSIQGAVGTDTASPASSPNAWPSSVPQPNGGLPTVAPKDSTPLPSAQAPTEAPDQINDVPRGGHAVNTANDNTATSSKKKNPKPKFKAGDESSSKHKKKKGLDKLNPF